MLGLVIVFYFKEKTAYDMRISDWSSDVCSSDLVIAGIDRAEVDLLVRLDDEPPVAPCLGQSAVDELDGAAAARHRRGVEIAPHEIGRASCRDRVCQYV